MNDRSFYHHSLHQTAFEDYSHQGDNFDNLSSALTNLKQRFFLAVSKDINAFKQAVLDEKFNIDTQIEGSRNTALHMVVADCNLKYA